jgi:hypothetical protein
MSVFVNDEEIVRVQKALESFPIIAKSLGADWTKNNLLNKQERANKHAIFWILLDDTKRQKMANWLSTLKPILPEPKFNKIINSLKEKKNEKEFYSFIPEVEVLAYYANKANEGIAIEYEPKIPGKNNVGDIKLTKGTMQIFLEITRLFESKEEERVNCLIDSLMKRINDITDNPFIITLGTKEAFCETDLEPCIKLVHDEIAKNKNTLEILEGKPYTVNFCAKAWFKFHKKITRKKGYVGGTLSPVMRIESPSRLKHKILDKLEQLPDNQSNIVILDISNHFADFDDVEDAFAGQLGLEVNVKTGEGIPVRQVNGVIHMDEGRQVGAIIAFKGFTYEVRRKYSNSSAMIPITDEILAVL